MLRWGLIVTSDRVKENPSLDRVTPLVEETLKQHGHTLTYKTIVGNNPVEILYAIAEALRKGADVVLATGGTGPNPRDITADIVYRLCDRPIPGVGEEFRRRSISRGVANAMLSRAGACGFAGRLLAVSPGNPDAVREMLNILLQVADHAVEQLRGAKHR
jgi:molybdenum cofactor biosynthesis protein B